MCDLSGGSDPTLRGGGEAESFVADVNKVIGA
jgi:hypothetical protein